ncbi:MAG: thiamine pyrophosphate-dependent enzyme [Paracoccaceae bacterium]
MATGGEILIDCLLALGSKKAFGIPGESYLAVLDAIYDKREDFDFILCRNEGGAAFMASAHGKLTQEPGLCFVTRGPGAMNAAIGVHTARQDSSPMILFVGQVGTALKGREAFQEIDYETAFRDVAKWSVEINEADRIPEIISRAWLTAVSGRPGPVVVALPEDILTDETDALPLISPVHIEKGVPVSETIEKVQFALSDCKRPLIIIGSSTWSQSGQNALKSFAESSKIPVVAAFRYQDQFDNFSSAFCGEAGVGMPAHVRELIVASDLIIAINIRFGEMTTDAYSLLKVPIPDQKLIHVHSAESELGKIYLPDIAIHADPNEFSRCLENVSSRWEDWFSSARRKYLDSLIAPKQPSMVDMGLVMQYLQEVLPSDVIITNGAGNFAVWPNKFYQFAGYSRLLAPQSGAMGYGVPAAIAAKSAFPNRTVVCFAGDGDFQMTCQELSTAAQIGIFPIILILNNSSYGTIRVHQEKNYPGRVSCTDIVNPNFTALAESFGFLGLRVGTTDEFYVAFESALNSERGAVLDLNVSSESLVPRQSLSDIRKNALNNQSKK